jgi:serine/threonine-protein kinase RsbW
VKKPYPRDFSALQAIVADTGAFFEEHGIDPGLRLKVDLAIEELFVNLVTYNTESHEAIAIAMRPVDDGIEVTLTDRGVDRFDPTQTPAVDLESPLSERTPGGLGLYLVSKMVDSIHYEYRDRTSKITFTNRTGIGERREDVRDRFQ